MPKKLSLRKEEKNNSKTKKKTRVSSKKISQEEYEKEVIKLADSGLTSEKIGENLRAKGIHPKEYKKKISKILKEANKYQNPDLIRVSEKLERIKEHYKNNKQDKKSMREKDRVFSGLRKIKKYFKLA